MAGATFVSFFSPRKTSEVERAVKGPWEWIGGTGRKDEVNKPGRRQAGRLYMIPVQRLDAAGIISTYISS